MPPPLRDDHVTGVEQAPNPDFDERLGSGEATTRQPRPASTAIVHRFTSIGPLCPQKNGPIGSSVGRTPDRPVDDHVADIGDVVATATGALKVAISEPSWPSS
jgi:hypothetical protein